ncbi:MAG: hypothetical protein KBT69_14370 [Oceanihabitans sp.]|nr:hypothetical protein [Oceanihabitans sp.]
MSVNLNTFDDRHQISSIELGYCNSENTVIIRNNRFQKRTKNNLKESSRSLRKEMAKHKKAEVYTSAFHL